MEHVLLHANQPYAADVLQYNNEAQYHNNTYHFSNIRL